MLVYDASRVDVRCSAVIGARCASVEVCKCLAAGTRPPGDDVDSIFCSCDVHSSDLRGDVDGHQLAGGAGLIFRRAVNWLQNSRSTVSGSAAS
jgi:hypothetical protein